MRDDFEPKVKDIMAKRVGYRCSNPNCRDLTCGPKEEPTGTVNVGVASHICAASPGGLRYDKNQTQEERKSIENGIWLCQTHGKLVDSDEKRYTVDILKKWKKLSEMAALLEIEQSDSKYLINDIKIIETYMVLFDRPAFQHSFDQEGSMENFDKAIEDTIIALNTGTIRIRNGGIIHTTEGKSYIDNLDWRERLNVISDLLSALRERYSLAVKQKEISLSNNSDDNQWYCINSRELSEWFDSTRNEVLQIFSSICSEAGLKPAYLFPRLKRKW